MTKFCNLCKRNVSPKRNVGVGSILLVVMTGGLWLIAILFYPKRCPICGTTKLLNAKSEENIEELKNKTIN